MITIMKASNQAHKGDDKKVRKTSLIPVYVWMSRDNVDVNVPWPDAKRGRCGDVGGTANCATNRQSKKKNTHRARL